MNVPGVSELDDHVRCLLEENQGPLLRLLVTKVHDDPRDGRRDLVWLKMADRNSPLTLAGSAPDRLVQLLNYLHNFIFRLASKLTDVIEHALAQLEVARHVVLRIDHIVD